VSVKAVSNMSAHPPRRGITLIEVLIAIGILAVGLSSVVALIPAGRSQASRAIVLDRAGNLAANALSDAATFGLLRPDSLTETAGLLVIDPLALAGIGTFASTGQRGIFSSGTATAAAPTAAQLLFTQGRDDLLFAPGATDDDPPLNMFSDGVRSFQGRMSCIYAIRPTVSGTPGRLSAVVFHGRDPGMPAFSVTLSNGVVNSAAPDLGDVIKPGVVLYGGTASPRFHQVLSFSIVAATSTAYLTFSTGTALLVGTHPLTVLPDSVGLAERTCTAEESGPYLQ
jgi:prepilin-type N-terminal cleavage/methylation domain-containing protein